jgi:transcriptional regulator with XRE-family HTH domain
METQQPTEQSRTQRFAEYMRRAVREAGYDIDSQRGGGRVALARDTGMSPSSVGRMLAGKTLPEPNHLEALAKALGVSLPDLLVQSGVVSRGIFPEHVIEAPLAEVSAPHPSPAEAAQMWGIKSPDRIAILESLVRTLQEQEWQDEGRGRSGKVV